MLRQEIREISQALISRLDSISHAIEQLVSSITERQSSEDKIHNAQRPIDIRAEIYTEEKEKTEKKTQEDKGYKLNRANTVVNALLLGGAIVTTVLLFRTLGETKRTADAAICATKIAANQYELARKQFQSSQAAVLQPEVSTRGSGPYMILLYLHNVGHTPATHVNATITLYRNGHRPQEITIKDQIISDRSVSADIVTGYMARFINLPKDLDLITLVSQNPRVITNLEYFNGLEKVVQDFCAIYLRPPNQGDNGSWIECEEANYYKQN